MLLGQSLKPVYGYEMQVLQIKFVCSFLSGPREIRTLDLLNAIETRSQLRYGPRYKLFLASHGAPNSPGRGLRALWAQV